LLLHPAGGELFCYAPLIRALRPQVAVSGFAADPTDAAQPPRQGMEFVAERLVQAMADHGPRDGFALAGWSYGGVLAFEMARRLEQEQGRTPPVLVLDGIYYGDVELEDEPTLRRRFVHDVARLAGRDEAAVRAALAGAAAPRVAPQMPDATGTDAEGAAPSPEPDPEAIRASLTALGVELDLTDRELWERYTIFRFCALSLQCYRPSGPYSGPVTVLTTEERSGVARRWSTACTGPFECVELPGDHYTLFAGEPLDTVVRYAEKALALVEAAI
jgi:thioesterase domain-containing protein